MFKKSLNIYAQKHRNAQEGENIPLLSNPQTALGSINTTSMADISSSNEKEGTKDMESILLFPSSTPNTITEEDEDITLKKRKELQLLLKKKYYQRKRQHPIESLDYDLPDNIPHRNAQRLKTESSHRVDDVRKWLTSFLIGVVTGLIAYFVHWSIDRIYHWKFLWMNKFVKHDEGNWIHVGFLIYTVFNMAITFVGSSVLIFLTPYAIGSGIPEVKGYLNGNRIPKAFNITTLLGKLIGVICSVSASMPCGPEGPMIHIGSLVGGGLGEFRSRTLKCSLPIMEDFRNSRDRRDFISCGAACGVSSAFGAPIGGVLFTLEEVSSHWNQQLTWRCFFGSMIACFTLNFFLSGLKGTYLRSLVLFEVSSYSVGYQLYEILIFVLIGLVGGLFAALFSRMVILFNVFRKRYVNQWRWRRCLEVFLWVLIVSTVNFYIPMLSKCRTRPDLMKSRASQSSEHIVMNFLAHNDTISATNFTLFNRHDSLADGHTESNSSSITTVAYTCGVNQYNELATLFLVTQEDAMKHMISRGLDNVFSLFTCAIFTILWFIGSGYTCGAALASGLVIPNLLVGAGFGRFVGLLVQLLFPSMKIDPGVYALIGASAFIGGVSRMTISMTVIILEITNDLQYLFPIMLVIMISKWVGDIFTHPLYDMLLHLKDVPYLESKPSYVMSKLKCSDIMAKPVIVLHETKETVEKIVQILASTDHNGFPVVRDCDPDSPLFHRSNSGPAILDSNFDDEERLSNTTIDMNLSSAQPKHNQILVGLISRKHLLILLKYTVLKNQRRFTEQELNSIVNGPHILLHRLVEKYTEEHWKKTLDLRDLVNYSSLYVNEQFSVEYAYQLFRSMGTRHLIVVNYHNQVVGMITRRDFLEKRLEEIYQKVKAKLNYYKRFQPNYYLSYLADQQI